MKRAHVFVILACTGCETILGFGETFPSSGFIDAASEHADASIEMNRDASEARNGDASRDWRAINPDGDDPSDKDTSLDNVREEPALDDASQEDATIGDTTSDASSLEAESRQDATMIDSRDDLSVVDSARDVDSMDRRGNDFPGDATTVDVSRDPGDDSPAQDALSDTPWSPRALPHLAIWLDAAVGVETEGGGITVWHDQSSHRHRAVPPDTMLTPTWENQGIGTYPGVAFAGIGDALRVDDSPSLQFGTRDFAVEVVFRHTTPLASTSCAEPYGAVYLKAITDISPYRGPLLIANRFNGLPGIQTQLDGYNFITTPDGLAYNDDVPRLVTMYRHGTLFTLQINGVAVRTISTPTENGAPPGVDANGYPLLLGAQLNKSQCLRGVIAELIAVSPVTPSELFELESYLLAKYGAALARDQ